MNLYSIVLAVATVLGFSMVTMAWIDYDLVEATRMNDTKEPLEYNISKKRLDRYTFVIDGTVAFTDLTGYEAELKIYHSAPDSTKFVLSPFKLPRAPVDQSLNQDYRKYLMNQVKEYSDLPYSEDETENLYDKFLNRKFTVNKFLLHNTTIPDIADGTYKCHLLIYKGKGFDVVNGIQVVLRLY